MAELMQNNWILVVLALIVAALIAWWIIASTRRTKVQVERDEQEQATTARRNQALIDAPPAVAPSRDAPPTTPIVPLGAGEAVAATLVPTPPETGPEAAVLPPVVDEPQAEPGPAAEATAPAPAQSTEEPGAELLRIKGVGPKLADQLRALGITSLAQIAAWDDAEIDRIDAQLGRFQGRIRRDNWPEQARLLTSGDLADYEARFGKL
jgi:predicted flap endonuclease-1-like 5' DNA nuclease